ncbi:hypothetical protein YC2023_041268 [Brassica napus]
MSSKKKLVYLDEIRPWKTTWFIEAKVIHTWKPSNTGFGETLEIILADKNGIKVHATCRKNYLKSLGDQCIVGEWKSIENFQVSEPGKHFRPTKLMYKIIFINQKVIKPYDFEDDDMFLSLAEFDSVLSGRLETEFLIDIVGQAIDVGELQILQSNGKELRKIEFTLRNISDVRIPCCLWGKFAEKMETHREEAQFGVVVCLIRFAKIWSFRGNLQISNSYDSSKLVFNLIIKEAEELKEWAIAVINCKDVCLSNVLKTEPINNLVISLGNFSDQFNPVSSVSSLLMRHVSRKVDLTFKKCEKMSNLWLEPGTNRGCKAGYVSGGAEGRYN